ncbi:hypothetical protein HAHI6034_13055 [Hathewaya histolytica]|uniref:Membrane protein n=1 Tax=Hathewaya histolytica TaxID=1498 RepID=A0A4V6KBI6_HATHI|nr:hypothetical protein [Hathewaya histolytica]VTQ82447.1 membrane protein [Hathewaya histolytica]
MFKLLKYNLKESFKYVSIILSMAVIAYIGILSLNFYNKINNNAVFIFYIMINFGVFLVTLIYIINAYKNELYEDRAYLTFTLPLKGREILGAKLLLSIILFIIVGIVCFGFFSPRIIRLDGLNFLRTDELMEIALEYKGTLIFSFFASLIQWLQFILTIFFSITLSKVSIKNKRVGFISFLIFILTNILIGYIAVKLAQLLPYAIDFKTLSIVSQSRTGDVGITNIAVQIYNIVVVIGIFGLTSLLLDKKIDL